MKIRPFILCFVAFVGLLAACSRNTIEVSKRNFEQEIEQQQNLVFTFNQDVAKDSLFNIWDTVQYVRFEPAVRGRFRWTAANELTFSPEIGFAAGTDYKATLMPLISDLATSENGKLSVNSETIAFHTPYLNLTGTDIFWNKADDGKIELRFNLHFNYKVNPVEVMRLLSIEIDGKKLAATPKSSVISETVEVVVNPADAQAIDEKAIKISVEKGLKCIESGHVSSEPITLETTVPSRADLSIMQVEAQYEGEQGFLHIVANQGFDIKNAARYIKFEPAVQFTVEALEYGFNIKGNFNSAVNYELTISEGLRGIFGGTLRKELQQMVVFGQPEPAINFSEGKAIYLSSKGEKNVAVSIVNVPKVNILLYKIYENNIMQHLRNTGLLYGGTEYFDGYGSFEEYGDLVMSREVTTKSLKKDANGRCLVNLDFADNNNFKGIYVLKVQDTENQYNGAQRTMAVSDVGLIARETDNRIVVFANSLLTAKPLKDAEITLVSTNNQQVYKVKTDENGVAVFDNIRRKAAGFRTQMLTARYENEFTYMHFQQTATDKSRYEVDGMYENASGYQAYIYGDRDIYRPSETMHFNVILRNDKWLAPEKLPVKFKVTLPNGREMLTQRAQLNAQGAFTADVKLPDAAVTGTYNVEVLTGNDVILNSQAISVEEFMPDRIRVNVVADKETVRPSETFSIKATAANLFGTNAAGRNYQTELTFSRENFAPKGYEDYKFNIEGLDNMTFASQYHEGKTDENGQFEQSFNVPTEFAASGLLKGRIYTTVFDENGRPVNRITQVSVPTQNVFAGIKYFDSYVDVNKSLLVPIVALNEKGKGVSTQLNVAVIKYEWYSVAQESYSGSGFRYVSQRKEKVMLSRSIAVNAGGSTSFAYVPATSGEYEIRVYAGDWNRYVAQPFYAYGFGYTSNTSFEVNKEGNIDIAFDKESYNIGEKADILFKTPFAGKMLVTVERNQVYEHFWLETDKKSAKLSLPIEDEYLPNIYVTATLFRPVDDGSMPITVGHGFKSVRVTDPETVLPVSIEAVTQAKSNSRQKITIKTEKGGEPVEVTIAVVDEGILQLKNYKSPNPHDFFFRKRALQVNSYDMYAMVFPELKARKNSKVGGDGYDLSRRVNPLTNKRVKLMAYWSGQLKTNSDGEASYTIDIPHFSGELRVMAVAYRGRAFGAAEKPMKVADDLVLSSSLPRFLSPADEVFVPVTLSNTTKRNLNVAVSLATNGAVQADGETAQNVGIEANSEKQIFFKVKAANQVGQANVQVTARAAGQTFTEKTDITVRPSASLNKQDFSGVLAAGNSANLDFGTDYLPNSGAGSLLVSASPLVQFSENLNSLLQYPYGCAEQTVSAAFPQIYFQEIAKTLYKKNPKQYAAMPSSNPNYNVQEAINKLQNMQLYDGGISYWAGSEHSHWWASAYAAHFLIEARNAGFEVNASTLDKLLSYLGQKAKAKELEKYSYYTESNQRVIKNIAPKEIAYSLYVLALAGRPDVPTMNYYKANKTLLAIDSKYLLGAAYLLASDQISYKTALPSAFVGERSVAANGGSFYSFVRDEAISLSCLVDVDANNPQIPMLARHLAAELKRDPYLSTQENSFALLALGKLAKKAANSKATASVNANGKALGNFAGTDLWLDKGLLGKTLNINVTGKGQVYYFGEMSGIPASGQVKEEDSYLRVRRSFYDRNGNAITGNTFRQNDLIVVKVTVSTTDASRVENIVLTDMLPAGFEVENSRLSISTELAWAKNASIPDHLDIRDDRVNIFTDAYSGERTYYYVVRAVSRGKFAMGAVSADAMYNGEYHSYNGAGTIEIVEREAMP